MESRSRRKQEMDGNGEGKDDVMSKEEVFKVSEKDEEATMMHPPEMPIVIDEVAVEDILGPAMYEPEMGQRLSQPGVAVGLAVTPMGGEIMFVEATRMSGSGKLTLTGQLGDVMKESANLARTWLRANATKIFGRSLKEELDTTDIHIHFPAGAVGKDGPSAGVTVITVLMSLFSDVCVRSDTAMTGEITLRGLVLPVGGIKEKVLAAHRAGLTRVILPARNEKDLHEIPANIKKEMSIILAARVEDVLKSAFEDGLPALALPQTDVASKL